MLSKNLLMAKTVKLYSAVKNTCWGGRKLKGPLSFKLKNFSVHIYGLSGSYGLFVSQRQATWNSFMLIMKKKNIVISQVLNFWLIGGFVFDIDVFSLENKFQYNCFAL